MKLLLQQIQEQEKISNQLEINSENRQLLLQKVSNFTNTFIEKLPNTTAFIEPKGVSSKLKIEPKTKSIDTILELFDKEVIESGIKAASGGHVGYIPGGGIYAAALGDFLAAVSNEYAGVFYASPGAVTIENEVISWLKKIFDFPESAVGNLASGGSMSNLIALTAARDKHGIKNDKIPKSVIYLSEQAHHCIKKSLRIIGLEDVIIRHLPLDDAFKIIPKQLESLLLEDKQNGLYPFLVIASAGTTDVGAIDPLDEIATIAHTNNLWFHVDAAYGGFFYLTSKKYLFKGIEQADSLVIDPHKGLFLPYGLGVVLVKDAKAVLHSNLYTANYMQDAITEDLSINPANVSPELTKHFRGMRLWLPLQLHGMEPFIACLEEKLLLTTYFREKLMELGFKVGPTPDLSVSYFWYPIKKKSANSQLLSSTQHEELENVFNQNLLNLIHEDGRVFLSSTTLHGKFVIRMAILSFRTKLTTIDSALSMIKFALEKQLK